ncbi:YIP1 family protein [Thermoproteota archaeon]
MSNEKPGYLGQVIGVLYRPRQIFSAVDESDLTKGLVVVLLMVALAGYSSMIYMNKIPLSVLAPQLEDINMGQIGGSMGIFAGIGGGVTILLGWVAATLLLHGLSKLAGGVGNMKRFFALHGFVSVPGVLNQLLRVADASIMDSVSLAGYYLSYRDIGSRVLKALLRTNLVNIWGLATLMLLVIAIEENYGATRNRAIMIALVPSVVYFAISYFTT